MNARKLLAVAMLAALVVGCQRPSPQVLREGDILFQDLQCGPLCEAINAVTQGVDGRNFSHCGMVVRVADTLCVVEAIGDCVQLASVRHFFARTGDTAQVRNVAVGRLRAEHQHLVPAATAYALRQLGIPYDDLFLPDNGKLYCSELIYEAFRAADSIAPLFGLRPMTYKRPNADEFFPAWADYYAALGACIPEGELGINPGLISTSEALVMVDYPQFVQ
ncbi:MAG: hypothetical protein IJU72_01820 [Bacteroidales bacterium]|nr:hypothetical protein [Bacteroidales bacterium]